MEVAREPKERGGKEQRKGVMRNQREERSFMNLPIPAVEIPHSYIRIHCPVGIAYESH